MERVYDPRKYEGKKYAPQIPNIPSKTLFYIPIKTAPLTTSEVKPVKDIVKLT